MMNEYVINTDDVGEFMKQLAANVIGEVETELSVSDSTSTRTVWFTPQDASNVGFTGEAVIYGLASTDHHTPIKGQTLARIQAEGNALVLIADL